MPKTWIFHPQKPGSQREVAQRLGISLLTARVLLNRGVESAEDAATFLHPKLAQLESPDSLADMGKACDRILYATSNHQKIMVFGDYDVDGVAATTLLVHLFRILRTEALYTVPNRLTESYSISPQAARRVIDSGAQLVITVDNGTTAFEGIDILTKAGVDVIVTDHHLPGDGMPNAHAIINPRREDCLYPFKLLSGTGVAFKLAWALGCTLSGDTKVSPEFREFLLDATAWAALGTVADLVPLVGENRVLAKFGLAALSKSRNPGLRALCDVCKIKDDDEIQAEDIAFRLAPRINAAGRMGQAEIALECLTSRSEVQGVSRARILESLNQDRRVQEKDIYQEAQRQVEENYPEDSILVLAHDEWSPGVIGIVASRLVQRYERPAILIALNGDRGKGSARTTKGFHLHNAFGECDDLLLSWGGHAMAAGMEIIKANVHAFRQRLNGLGRESIPANSGTNLYVDAEIPLSALTIGAVREIERLGPFGQGHPRPVFASEPVELAEPPRAVGGGRHLQLHVKQGPQSVRAIAYGMGSDSERIRDAHRLGIAYSPMISTFRGYPTVELQVLDFRTEVEEFKTTSGD